MNQRKMFNALLIVLILGFVAVAIRQAPNILASSGASSAVSGLFNSPLPTPPVPSPTPDPGPSPDAQKALTYLVQRESALAQNLIIVNEFRRDSAILGRTFQAVAVLDGKNRRIFHLLVDRQSGQVQEVTAVQSAEDRARQSKYGKLQPALYERLQTMKDDDIVTVMIWTVAEPGRSLSDREAAAMSTLAAKYPEARAAVERGGIPMDVDDPELAKRIYAEYIELLTTSMTQRIQPLISALEAQGFTVLNSEGMPAVTATLPKKTVQILLARADVGMIYLAEGGKRVNELNSAIPTNRAPAVWARGFDGTGVSIAVIESDNVDFDRNNNNSANSQCPPGTNNCFLHLGTEQIGADGLTDYHATLVASIAASNHPVYKGMAPGATVLSAGIQAGEFRQASISALLWAFNSNADVVNASFGLCNMTNPSQLDVIDKAFDYWARAYRRLIVKSAGNFPNCDTSYVTSPGKGWNILTTGAYDDQGNSNWADDTMAWFSNWGNPDTPNGDHEKPEVVAPGVNVVGIGLNGNLATEYYSTTGTSMAAPQVSGLAALLINRRSSLRYWPEASRAIIMASAVHNISGTSRLSEDDGAGGIDAILAYRTATISNTSPTVPCTSSCWWSQTITTTNLPIGGWLNRYFKATHGEHIRVAIAWWSNADCPSVSNCNSDVLGTDLDLTVYGPDGWPVSGAYAASWDNNYEIVDFTAPDTGQYTIGVYKASANEDLNYLGIAFVKDATYIPDLRNKDGWVSELYVRNEGAVLRDSITGTKVAIRYFDALGQQTLTDLCGLRPNEWCRIRVDENNRIPAGNTGSAIVSGGEDVSVVVVNRAATSAGYAYSGQPVLNAPATTLYLPETLDLGTWQMRFPVLNAGSTATNITTQFLETGGGTRATQVATSVPVNGQSNAFPLLDLDPNNNYFGAGRISASQPIAAVAQAYDNSSRSLGHWATPTYGQIVWLPFVMTRLDNGWGATIWVQNTSGTTSTVSLDFFQGGSRSVIRTTGAVTLPANGMTSFNLRTSDYGLGWGWFGSARVTAGQPVAVIVNQLNDGSNLGASYEGVLATTGSNVVVLPYVVRGNGGCFYSNFTVRNLGSSDASISINYYHSVGTSAIPTPSTDTVVSHQVYNLYAASPVGQTFPAAPFEGSVVINSNQPIAVSSNLLNYCSGNDTVSYTGINR